LVVGDRASLGTTFGLEATTYVSTTGKDEKLVREYIRRQEEGDRRLDQLGMFK
jgi:hypothetical protein